MGALLLCDFWGSECVISVLIFSSLNTTPSLSLEKEEIGEDLEHHPLFPFFYFSACFWFSTDDAFFVSEIF
jgi:hypothetical protein